MMGYPPMKSGEDARPLTAEEETVVRESLTGSNALPVPFSTPKTPLPRVHYDLGLVRRLIATLDAARADTAGIDAAWQEAEAALPEGWYFTGLTCAGFRPKWHASAMAETTTPDETCDHGQVHRGKRGHVSALGPTPAAALHALAAALRTPKPEGDR